MTRESKLALIIGFVLVLVVGVLVSDHFSQANTMDLDIVEPESERTLGLITDLGQREKQGLNDAIENAIGERSIASSKPTQQESPVIIRNGQRSSGDEGDRNSILDRAFNHVQGTEFPKAAQRSRSTELQPLPTVQYPTYKVVEGDTLIGIARRMLGNGERWIQIHQLNADVLGPDAILKIGVYLKLPNEAKVNTPRRSNTPRLSSSKTYTVVSGDTLGQISMRLLGTFRRANEIVELNGLESANDIRIGMTLKIPAK